MAALLPCFVQLFLLIVLALAAALGLLRMVFLHAAVLCLQLNHNILIVTSQDEITSHKIGITKFCDANIL
jgi:hypothetical protein